MTDYSKVMQSLVDKGDRIVAVLEGGLLFGLPSIQATQVTFPIISCPMDMVAYTAFIVPSGHSVIAGVGVDRGDGLQKANALTLAERMLNLEKQIVGIINYDYEDRLGTELEKLGINHKMVGCCDADSTHNPDIGFYVQSGVPLHHQSHRCDSFLLYSYTDENLSRWEYLETAEKRNHVPEANLGAQIRGIQNLAVYSAKILSLQNSLLRVKIKQIAIDKRETYNQRKLV